MNSIEQSIAWGNNTNNIKFRKQNINITNSTDKACIIYVDNYGNEISRDYLRPKLLES
jgi:hypothetical protein